MILDLLDDDGQFVRGCGLCWGVHDLLSRLAEETASVRHKWLKGLIPSGGDGETRTLMAVNRWNLNLFQTLPLSFPVSLCSSLAAIVVSPKRPGFPSDRAKTVPVGNGAVL